MKTDNKCDCTIGYTYAIGSQASIHHKRALMEHNGKLFLCKDRSNDLDTEKTESMEYYKANCHLHEMNDSCSGCSLFVHISELETMHKFCPDCASAIPSEDQDIRELIDCYENALDELMPNCEGCRHYQCASDDPPCSDCLLMGNNHYAS